ncbi:hypothetical protein RFI_17518 [Reticulomyxa filosa]|uniref:Uncharacterized protein n=1 Tax=Reticulomyxa filosa TaxID=46433 RepID=X6N320_RETFI|nr:hypothetical protein RFI_17518 [Reticulomyxa filosa]|eukprot:ETO19712.1 hypothetical protein RFI_17518 [Reticulomyxa filosa]
MSNQQRIGCLIEYHHVETMNGFGNDPYPCFSVNALAKDFEKATQINWDKFLHSLGTHMNIQNMDNVSNRKNVPGSSNDSNGDDGSNSSDTTMHTFHEMMHHPIPITPETQQMQFAYRMGHQMESLEGFYVGYHYILQQQQQGSRMKSMQQKDKESEHEKGKEEEQHQQYQGQQEHTKARPGPEPRPTAETEERKVPETTQTIANANSKHLA